MWKETLGWRLGSHDAVEPAGGTCYGKGFQKEVTRLHGISCRKESPYPYSITPPGAVWIPSREQGFQSVNEDSRPFQQKGSEPQVGNVGRDTLR